MLTCQRKSADHPRGLYRNLRVAGCLFIASCFLGAVPSASPFSQSDEQSSTPHEGPAVSGSAEFEARLGGLQDLLAKREWKAVEKEILELL